MNPSIRKLLFLLAVGGACGLLVQACAIGPGVGIVWDVSQPVRILPNATSDDQRYKIFQTQLDSQSDGKYDTTFQGKISEARTCYKIDAGTNSEKIQCSELPHPDAIHVAQRVSFADQAHQDAFLKNLGL